IILRQRDKCHEQLTTKWLALVNPGLGTTSPRCRLHAAPKERAIPLACGATITIILTLSFILVLGSHKLAAL
ncbi:unnamed protein product, partial [Oikopleura dioica]